MFYLFLMLLMYVDFQIVFWFLYVFIGCIQSVGGFGVFIIDVDVYDDWMMNIIKQLFDGIIMIYEDVLLDICIVDYQLVWCVCWIGDWGLGWWLCCIVV